MKIIKPSFSIWDSAIWGSSAAEKIAWCGKTCYQSEVDKDPSAFVGKIMERGHYSVLEHVVLTVKFVCSRSLANQIVRHRLGAYSQESTRYCNYSQERFGRELTFIEPCFFTVEEKDRAALKRTWEFGGGVCESLYLQMIEKGAKPEEARALLPLSLKTELAVTYNIRQWLHVLETRLTKASAPEMLQMMLPLAERFAIRAPEIFGNLWSSRDGDALVSGFIERYGKDSFAVEV